MFACRYSFVFVNCFMLLLFLLRFFHRPFKVSGLLVAVCIPAFHNTNAYLVFPITIWLFVQESDFFPPLFVAKLKECEGREWKFTYPNATLFSFINFLWLLNLKLACQCEMISLYLTVSFQYRLELFLTKEAWIGGNYILNAGLFV